MAMPVAMPEPWTPEGVAVVGGGRWARVLASELARIEPPIGSIVLVSAHNAQGMRQWLEHDDLPGVERFQVTDSLDAALQDPAIEAAIVATMPAAHYDAAQRSIAAGVPVLVEKPLCPTAAEAAELIDLADQAGLALAVGHEMHFVSWVKRLSEIVSAAVQFELEWIEPSAEHRHGHLKQPDWSVGVVADLLPHALTIGQCVTGTSECSVTDVEVSGPAATVRVTFGAVEGTVRLVRDGAEARRRCAVVQADGESIVVDFTSMPAVITQDGRVTLVDDDDSSIKAELQSFFAAIAVGESSPVLACDALGIVAATEQAVSLVRGHTERALRSALRRPVDAELPADLVVALREHVLAPLFREGLIADPKDLPAIDRWIGEAFAVVHELATKPFEPVAAIAERRGLDLGEMRRLSSVIRQTPLLQEGILRGGVGWKYWVNTIVPLIRSGSVKAALDRTPAYPFRVGVYLGLSCMFKCTFCGRNYDAKYDRQSYPDGNAMFRRLFDRAPTDDPHRFYLSGGLEPLTNPEMGDLVRHGTERGFELSLYTNASMLTSRYLERHEGLWDLATLRVSLYGVDEETTFAVTRRPNAYAQVVRNAETFMRERNRRGADVRFGFNFVILPGCSDQVLRVAELIAELNRRTGGRQVDFLTLREDYSVPAELGLGQPAERAALMDVFERLEERMHRPDLDALQVDYGYSLQALVEGTLGRPLERVGVADMRPAAYPQISVVVDLLGDVYAYREAGFLDRPGVDRYIIGRVTQERPLEHVVADWVAEGRRIAPKPGDDHYFDIFDHVVTALLNQAEQDARAGIPFSVGPVASRDLTASNVGETLTLAHPTLEKR